MAARRAVTGREWRADAAARERREGRGVEGGERRKAEVAEDRACGC